MLYTRGLARAAHDTGQKFPLKPDFRKTAKAFQADNMARKALKVKKDSEIYGAAQKRAKKMGLDRAAQLAATTEALKDTLTGTTVGFISAQVGLAVVDVLGTIVSLGAYAAAAPAVHSAVAAGQTVTTTMIKSDIAKNEQKYKAEIERLQAKKEMVAQKKEAAKGEKEAKDLEEMAAKAAALEKGGKQEPEKAAPAQKPWYASTGVLIGGGFVVGLAIFAATRKPKRF
jgi:predicted RecB family endonuclease